MSGPQAGLHAVNESHKYGGSECLLPWEPSHEVMPLPSAPIVKRPVSLVIETATVGVGVITAIRLLNVQSVPDFRWLLIPCLLVVAALLPTWLRKREFPPLFTDRRDAGTSLAVVSVTCLCTLPAVFLGLWLMVRMRLPIPLRPVVAGPDGWFTWLIYQFLYVAVSEEVFFRGYLQANVMRCLGDAGPRGQYVGILISAGCFAVAHVVVQGQIASILTFLPGLILAWLLIRTRSLLAPILFHGLANVSYGVIALISM